MSERTEQDARAADRIEAELLAATDELQTRVQRVKELRSHYVAKAKRIALIGGATAGVVLLGVLIYRLSTRSQRLLKEARKGLVRAVKHPERLATGAPEEPVGLSVAKRALGALVVAFVTQAAKRAAQRAVPA